MESLSRTVGLPSKKLSKKENRILEAETYSRIYEEIKEIFKNQYRDYFHVFKINSEMEDLMSEKNFLTSLINDILQTESYTLTGIAYYTQTPEDIIQDLLIRNDPNLILIFYRKLIELHKTVRPEIYKNILKKISDENK